MTTKEKLMPMSDAVDRYVHHGDTLYLGGFIQNEPFAAAHEIIRQGKKGLTVSKCAGVTVTDQMIGAGVVSHLITSFTWNPLPGTAHCFVRAVNQGIPHPIQLEEYPLFALNLAFFAGSMGLPYVATKTLLGSGFDGEKNNSGVRNRLRFEHSPFTGERVCLVPPIKHDVGIIQVQRSDPHGNAQAWGMTGETRYGLQSCDRIIICAEEVAETDVIMRDPNRTLVPAFRVQAVVEEPWGGHPQPLAGCYDMDWTYFAYYEQQTQTEEKFQAFMKKWVFDTKDRKAYLGLLGEERLKGLRPEPSFSDPISYGRLTRHFEAPHD
jgi:glutaconate CoA-transferase subunit A